MKKTFSAGVILYKIDEKSSKNMYLVLLYPKGYWDLPKGKLEPNETNLQAAVRELKEETNLDAQILRGFEENLNYFFKNFKNELTHKEVTFFAGKALDDNVILSDEHIGFKWLFFDEALEHLGYENAKEVLIKANNFINSY